MALLAKFKLDAKADDFAASLSGGQRKLLEMARALMSEPQLVMLDEPMAGVNPALTQSLLDHILDLKDEGMTVLFVEHDMHMVRHIADWVVVMAEGRIVAEGDPHTVMRNPAVIDAYLGAHQELDLGVVTGRYRRRRGRPDDGCRGIRDGQGSDARGGRHRRTGGRAASEHSDRTTATARRLHRQRASPATCRASTSSTAARSWPQQGELIGIIGPNGAGKSTLLKAIFGQVNVRSGTITLEGDDITGLQRQQARRPRRRLRAAEQQRLPEPHHRREPADGAVPAARRPTRSASSS